MTKGFVTALCLSAQTLLCTPAAGAQEFDLSILVEWKDNISAIVRALEEEPGTSFRLFNPERLYPGAADRTVEDADWTLPVTTTKSGRQDPGLSLSAEGGGVGLVLRF